MLAVVAVAPMIAAIVAWWWRAGARAAAAPTADQVDHAHRTLAALVLGQWREEILVRRLDDPTPLMVRWRLTDLPVMDLRDHVFPRPPLGLGRKRFEGRADRVGELAEEYRRLARRRLVILGGPGMGKTTMAVLLVRELLRRYDPGAPVPVLLSISDWSPGDEPLRDWLARRLDETYPALRAADFGPGAADAMIAQRRILPVLDGLDELPEPVRPGALAALNAALTADDPLILTCRTAEYAEAIGRGTVLAGAAVIEPESPRTEDIASYLRGCLHEDPGGAWADLVSALADPDAPAARALTTPLDLWLLRRVYIDTGDDPAVLLDTGRFPAAEDITDHLLDHLVGASISGWDSGAALRWLSFLADHLREAKRHDIAWWCLYRAAPLVRPVDRLVGGLIFGVFFGAVGGLAGAFGGGLATEPLAGGSGAALGWFVAGPIVALTGELTARPSHASLRLRGRARALVRDVSGKLALGVPVGMITATVGELGGVPFTPLLAFGLGGALLGGLVAGVLEWVATPLPDDVVQSPAGTLRRDLRLMVGRTVAALFLGGFLVGVTAGLVGGAVVVLVLGVEGATAILLVSGLARWTCTASSVYLVAVVILSARRNVPRRMMRFLHDAHRAGLLRRVGPVYEFRHAKLQERLARTHRRDT